MSTYAIGDIQGCFKHFSKLLKKINFNSKIDKLWLVGDIINRGKNSIQMLEWAYKNRDNINIVLGNHELHTIAVYFGIRKQGKFDTIAELLKHKQCDKWMAWLRQQPLIYYDKNINFAMTHAGIPPQFTLEQALKHAKNLHQQLSAPEPQCINFMQNLFGDQPLSWSNNLNNQQQSRYLINAFTRMRWCSNNGTLELEYKGPNLYSNNNNNNNNKAWFLWENRKTKTTPILFGHWAALENILYPTHNVFALDTGCSWGKKLTAFKLETQEIFQV